MGFVLDLQGLDAPDNATHHSIDSLLSILLCD